MSSGPNDLAGLYPNYNYDQLERRVEALERYVYDLEARVKSSLDHVATGHMQVVNSLQAITKILMQQGE